MDVKSHSISHFHLQPLIISELEQHVIYCSFWFSSVVNWMRTFLLLAFLGLSFYYQRVEVPYISFHYTFSQALTCCVLRHRSFQCWCSHVWQYLPFLGFALLFVFCLRSFPTLRRCRYPSTLFSNKLKVSFSMFGSLIHWNMYPGCGQILLCFVQLTFWKIPFTDLSVLSQLLEKPSIIYYIFSHS